MRSVDERGLWWRIEWSRWWEILKMWKGRVLRKRVKK
jgi:hypothetical protein